MPGPWPERRGHRAVYIGRFAPSPTGPLHAGSLVAALASWLDARAAGGRWLVRIEDADRPRCPTGMGDAVLAQLEACGLQPDEAPWWQSRRDAAYAAALQKLFDQDLAYPCACTRSEIEGALLARGGVEAQAAERVYPGTCRNGLNGRVARAVRFNVARALASARDVESSGRDGLLRWCDRRLGRQQQDVAREVGDFVLKRADGLWAYQLAVVVDDAAQAVTDVVRGEDLADNTPRQLLLQQALGLPRPRYLHAPLVLAADGRKLSKQNGAAPVDGRDAPAALRQALGVLGLPATAADGPGLLSDAILAWRARVPP